MNAKPLSRKKDRERRTLRKFVEVFCARRHSRQRGDLCPECTELLVYAEDKLARCPFDPKPKCRKCTVHCYGAEQREKIREVMRFSGIYFVKRGRLDWLIRYFMT